MTLQRPKMAKYPNRFISTFFTDSKDTAKHGMHKEKIKISYPGVSTYRKRKLSKVD